MFATKPYQLRTPRFTAERLVHMGVYIASLTPATDRTLTARRHSCHQYQNGGLGPPVCSL
ncbi:hypothetical protein E2C01_011526 [Portunus trituberculatus]|uniref:Uncharacterized protein n=1 Tax=Portunus trituberculatus TaxID=210409 RepID=A0A5B7DC11_PORTR|nr:hypothetical protein [Portunus trituberculatus]